MKKYFLIFTFTFLIPAASHSEIKKLNPKQENTIKEIYFEGSYTGVLATLCQAYYLGYINKDQKIELIEPVRKQFYTVADDPKKTELKILKDVNIITKEIFNQTCFPEI